MPGTCPSCEHVVTRTQRFCDVCGEEVEGRGRFPWWRLMVRPHRESFMDVVMRSWEYQLKLLYYTWPFYVGVLVSVVLLFEAWLRGLLSPLVVGVLAAFPVLLNAVVYFRWLRSRSGA